MSIGSTNVGGVGLNFKVKAYPSLESLPASAPENTIAIITDAAITDWELSPAAPEHKAGLVWINTANASSLKIQAVKRKSIFIHPGIAYQSNGNSWTVRDYRVFQRGAWQQSFTAIFNATINADVIGTISGTNSVYNGMLTIGIQSSTGDDQRMFCEGEKQIDLTNISKIYVYCHSINITQNWHTRNLYAAAIRNQPVKSVQLVKGWNVLNVTSLTGPHFIGMYFECGTGVSFVRVENNSNRPGWYLE